MKPRNREINIFNLSMMDVISGALGALLIIVIILYPYYKKDLIKENQELQEKLEAAETARQQAEQREQETQKALENCQEKMAKTFLVILIKWKTNLHDVDLHVIDPSGAEFYYEKKIIPGRPGELSEDDTSGPGNEVWEIREAETGQYRILFNLFDRHGNNDNPVVSGRIFYRDSSFKIPDTVLSIVKEKKQIITIRVLNNGNVEIN